MLASSTEEEAAAAAEVAAVAVARVVTAVVVAGRKDGGAGGFSGVVAFPVCSLSGEGGESHSQFASCCELWLGLAIVAVA